MSTKQFAVVVLRNFPLASPHLPSFPLKWDVGSELRFLQQHCSKEGRREGEREDEDDDEVAIGRVPGMHHATYIHLPIRGFQPSSTVFGISL